MIALPGLELCFRLSGKRNPSANWLKHKESNMYNDLTFLEGKGLLELKEGKNHVKKVPVIDYDAQSRRLHDS
ncbi:MAG: hypothetical protein O8C66_03900 [Candidatus Methanoperedens sp.]|nr:hypothetical protein [Candidatus Methanoperedens sp.]MCZ7369630.1 hypothetical protein [Candidatus Methanoperedens sp.]